MKGLLVKEGYGMVHRFRIFLAVLIVMAVAVPFMEGEMQVFGAIYIGFIASMVPMNSMAYDEKSGWDFYSQTLPVSKKQLVLSKYILGMLFLMAGIVLYFIGIGANAVFLDRAVSWDVLKFLLLEIMTAGLLPMILTLPLNFKMGVEKGRMTVIIAIAVFGACNAFLNIGGEINLNIPWIAEIMMALLILFWALSYHISCKIYEKREL